MPFTLSHAAAIYPIRKIFKKRLPLSALIIGSFSPDFRYAVYSPELRDFSHSLEGLILFCLPVSLLGLFIFHFLIKKPLVQLLPSFINDRINPTQIQTEQLSWQKIIAVILAIILGASSHSIWDSFTHSTGLAVQSIPLLKVSILKINSYDLRLYKFLQHASSFLGVWFIFFWLKSWIKRTPRQESRNFQRFSETQKLKFWLAGGWLSIFIGILIGIWRIAPFSIGKGLRIFVVQTGIGMLMAFTMFLIIFGLTVSIMDNKKAVMGEEN
ncbi:MAG: DUF4184 family protein [Acidobacteriota bacterium]